jgi:hypothetical protein
VSYTDDARHLLFELNANSELWPDLTAPMLIAQRANIAAQLAIEERLGQIVRALSIGNVVAAFGTNGAIRSDDDFREASRTVNALLFPNHDNERS